jgi:hypothetical protein
MDTTVRRGCDRNADRCALFNEAEALRNLSPRPMISVDGEEIDGGAGKDLHAAARGG